MLKAIRISNANAVRGFISFSFLTGSQCIAHSCCTLMGNYLDPIDRSPQVAIGSCDWCRRQRKPSGLNRRELDVVAVGIRCLRECPAEIRIRRIGSLYACGGDTRSAERVL